MDFPSERVESTTAQQESAKLAYDLFKHLTTLSTGSLLVIVALIEQLFKNPKGMYLLSGTFIFFTITIVLAVWNMLHMVQHVREPISGKEGTSVSVSVLINLFTFLAGIICITVFAFKNFYA